jgi:hypothetical protein
VPNPITSALALPVTLSGSPALSITDSSGTRTATFPNEVFRHFLAYVSGATPGVNSGTEADPHEAGKYLQYKLNNNGALAHHTITFTTDGRWQWFYASTGTASITWDGTGGTSAVLARLYGWTGNTTATAASSSTAQHQPFGFAACESRPGSTGRTYEPPKVAAARMPDGSAYGWSDGYTNSFQSFNVAWLPKDAAAKSSFGVAGTPAYPTSITRERAVLTAPSASYTLPYSWWEAIAASLNLRCGFAQGNLQRLIAASESTFLDVYVDPSTITKAGALKPQVANWDQFWTWEGVTLLTRAAALR